MFPSGRFVGGGHQTLGGADWRNPAAQHHQFQFCNQCNFKVWMSKLVIIFGFPRYDAADGIAAFHCYLWCFDRPRGIEMAQRLSTAPCDDYQPFEAGEHNTSQTFIYLFAGGLACMYENDWKCRENCYRLLGSDGRTGPGWTRSVQAPLPRLILTPTGLHPCTCWGWVGVPGLKVAFSYGTEPLPHVVIAGQQPLICCKGWEGGALRMSSASTPLWRGATKNGRWRASSMPTCTPEDWKVQKSVPFSILAGLRDVGRQLDIGVMYGYVFCLQISKYTMSMT